MSSKSQQHQAGAPGSPASSFFALRLEQLPTDTLVNIAGWLDIQSLLRLGRSSQRTKELVLNEAVWHNFDQDRYADDARLFRIRQLHKNAPAPWNDLEVGQRVARSLLRHCPIQMDWLRALPEQPPCGQRLGGVYCLVGPKVTSSEPYVSASELLSIHAVPKLHVLDAWCSSLQGMEPDACTGRRLIRPSKWNWLLQNAATHSLRHLRVLRLGDDTSCQIDVNSVELLARLPELHTLALNYSLPLSPPGLLAPLYRLPTLTSFHFPTDFLAAARHGAPDVARCTSLRGLSVSCFDLDGDGFEEFFGSATLRHSLEALRVEVFDRSQDEFPDYRPISPDRSAYEHVFGGLQNLRVVWVDAGPTVRSSVVNPLLAHLVLLPALEVVFVTFNASILGSFSGDANIRNTFLPSVESLQRLVAAPSVRAVYVRPFDSLGQWLHDAAYKHHIDQLMDALRAVPRVHCCTFADEAGVWRNAMPWCMRQWFGVR